MKHYADVGQPETLCGIALVPSYGFPYASDMYEDPPHYTHDPEELIDCPACLIRAVRGDDAPPAEEILPDVRDRIAKHEAAGLRYCFTCMSWEDDTDCYPGDHSRHCGHELKPLGMEKAPDLRLVCTAKMQRILAEVIRESQEVIGHDQLS